MLRFTTSFAENFGKKYEPLRERLPTQVKEKVENRNTDEQMATIGFLFLKKKTRLQTEIAGNRHLEANGHIG